MKLEGVTDFKIRACPAPLNRNNRLAQKLCERVDEQWPVQCVCPGSSKASYV